MTDYQKQTQDFLTNNGLRFSCTRKDDRCPLFCRDGRHIHGARHLVMFKGKKTVLGDPDCGRYVSFSFWNSIADESAGKEPTAYDVLAVITKYEPGTFADFCHEYGYDQDRRSAEKIYKAVRREFEKVSNFFTEQELHELREIS